ncbi:MAG: Do family serine endopeptidase [Xanthobacteraceae bacterium]|nr:Do family serine endopeptidase [Xanthobacteraceae bacterium]MBX3533506.1 Do family serine endopeptidase [Xanthobacteraceae bacterium]MBX3550676.1 Do family serine endopeptidase [Xanthobacteraceae bacterium]MCW5676446.1 Do family serine endopeptidase [Xanthobacteraceae bacterium]
MPALRDSGSRLLIKLCAAVTLTALLTGAPHVSRAQTKGPDNVADVAERVQGAVVNISTSQNVAPSQGVPMPQLPPGSPFEEFFDEFFKNKNDGDQKRSRKVSSLGSGFVIDASGIVVTNNHVIADADEIIVNFTDGTKLKAELIGRDEKVDLAVLRVKPKTPLKAVNFGDSDKTRVGEWVMAIGNPFGLGGSVTVGVVSARNRNIESSLYDDFIQTDAAINRGNSGGPLFNLQGEVIGINTAIFSQTGGSIGIGFSIPSNTVSPLIKQLIATGEIQRGWIGVSIQPVDDQIAESLSLPSTRGALIASVNDKGPAMKGGMLAGDVVIRFNGQDVREMRNLPRIVAGSEIGKTVDVVVIRKGKEQTLKIHVEKLVEPDKIPKRQTNAQPQPQPKQNAALARTLGLDVNALNDELRRRYKFSGNRKGLVITSVDPESNAAEQNIEAGLLLAEVSGEPVGTALELRNRVEVLKKAGKKSALLLIVNPDGEQRFVAVAIP